MHELRYNSITQNISLRIIYKKIRNDKQKVIDLTIGLFDYFYPRISGALKESERFQQASTSVQQNSRNGNQRSFVRMQSKF